MKKYLSKIGVFVFIVVVLVTSGLIVSSSYVNKTSLGQSAGTNLIRTMNISTGVSVLTSSTQLLAPSSARVYAVIVNSGTNPVYMNFGTGAAIVGSGIYLAASGGTYQINYENQYIGNITAIASGGTSVVTVTASQ